MPDNNEPDDPEEIEDELLKSYLEDPEDEEILSDLEDRQQLDQAGREALRRRLREHTAESPLQSGGDLDAAWDAADGGEEVIGGQAPTPDQDQVDELGEGAGLTYQDDEPLNYAKVSQRDQHRWELNPASASEFERDEPEAEGEDDLEGLGVQDDDAEVEAISIKDVDDLKDEVEEEAAFDLVDDEDDDDMDEEGDEELDVDDDDDMDEEEADDDD